jgi:isoleucyl-tRNA synthetase
MRVDFKRLGVLGDWGEPYLTMNYGYQAAITRALGRFVEQGLVYKGKKPVHWCTHCRTALAEAEVEYEDHTSPSIYVEFPLASESAGELAARIPALAGRDVSVLIWTTTPWTMAQPRRRSIPTSATAPTSSTGHHPRLRLAGTVGKATGKPLGDPIVVVKGEVFDRLAFQHPLYDRPSISVLADYVTPTPAPASPPRPARSDDYATGVRYGWTSTRRSAPAATTRTTCCCSLACRCGRQPEGRGAARARRLWHREVQYSYPHCWRCHSGHLPGHVAVVHRHGSRTAAAASRTLQAQSLEAIQGVQWIPSWGQAHPQHARQSSDWCISRQRS